MKARLAAACVVVAMLACRAPALADGKTNTILAGIAAVSAGVAVSNYDRKARIRRQEVAEEDRRMQAYRQWFHRKNRRYPNDQEIYDWYVNAYGVKPWSVASYYPR